MDTARPDCLLVRSLALLASHVTIAAVCDILGDGAACRYVTEVGGLEQGPIGYLVLTVEICTSALKWDFRWKGEGISSGSTQYFKCMSYLWSEEV